MVSTRNELLLQREILQMTQRKKNKWRCLVSPR